LGSIYAEHKRFDDATREVLLATRLNEVMA
jgi:hypothetical protein